MILTTWITGRGWQKYKPLDGCDQGDDMIAWTARWGVDYGGARRPEQKQRGRYIGVGKMMRIYTGKGAAEVREVDREEIHFGVRANGIGWRIGCLKSIRSLGYFILANWFDSCISGYNPRTNALIVVIFVLPLPRGARCSQEINQDHLNWKCN